MDYGQCEKVLGSLLMTDRESGEDLWVRSFTQPGLCRARTAHSRLITFPSSAEAPAQRAALIRF